MGPTFSIEAINKGNDINLELIGDFAGAISLFYRFCRATPWIFIVIGFVTIPILTAYGVIQLFKYLI